MPRLALRLILVAVPTLAQTNLQSPIGVRPEFVSLTESRVDGGEQVRGLIHLSVPDLGPLSPEQVVDNKRFILRMPASAKATARQAPAWNGSLVIGAHGGGGGNNFDRSGNVIGTDETALDDVIGRHVLSRGFAYASVDRDGAGNGELGLKLTNQFTRLVKLEVARRGGRAPGRVYLVGLSAGGGLARLAAEDNTELYSGTLIIAGAGGDLATRLDRQTRMAALWPLIDPRANFGMPVTDPKMVAYAEAVGTPVGARRLWPYTGAGAVAVAARPPTATETMTGRLRVPTIEVVGTWDDLVIREVRAYSERAQPKASHRVYQVEGVWHMSGDDDGVMSFQYIATARMKLDPDVANAMGEGPSYLPTVREAFDYLVRWVERETPAPPSQTVKPGSKLR